MTEWRELDRRGVGNGLLQVRVFVPGKGDRTVVIPRPAQNDADIRLAVDHALANFHKPAHPGAF